MSFSDFWEDEILDHIFNKGAYTAPANIYVGLSTADPGDDAAGLAEPVGNAYARVSTAGADWNVATAGLIDNVNAVTFPEATGSWGTITYVGLFDALSGGNLLGSGALTVGKAIVANDTAQFAAGDLDVTLD
jgi:hypothetical protein